MISKSSNSLAFKDVAKKQANLRLRTIFITLIILYSYLSPMIFGVLRIDYANYVFLNAIASYTLVVASIMIFSPSRLVTFRDHFSLWMVVFACLLSVISPGENTIIYRSVFTFLGLALSVYIIVNREGITTPSLKSFVVGVCWSIGAVVVLALASAFLGIKFSPIFSSAVIINSFRFQLAFVSVAEEALFRGITLSLLLMNGSNENKALFVQAMLFWGMHYLDLSNPVLFFIIIPLGTLFMTLLIKQYKLLYLPVIMHTLLNVFVALLTMLITSYMFRIR